MSRILFTEEGELGGVHRLGRHTLPQADIPFLRQTPLVRHPPFPQDDTPFPSGRHPLHQADPPLYQADPPSGRQLPPPSPETATAADGMHLVECTLDRTCLSISEEIFLRGK